MCEKLKAENRQLKEWHRRYEQTILRYGDTSVTLQHIICTYKDDLRMMQKRTRELNSQLRQTRAINENLTSELAALQKEHKHLLDLSKNKQLEEREKLSNNLEESIGVIKELEKKSQSLSRALELQKKNHRERLVEETDRVKLLQSELKRMKDKYEKLYSEMEIFKYKSYGGRRSFVRGISTCSPDNVTTKLVTITGARKELMSIRNAELCIGEESFEQQTTNVPRKSIKPELKHEDSEISEHTSEMQITLMRQIHQDVIEKPKMLMKNDTTDFSDRPWANRDIVDMLKVDELESKEADNSLELDECSGAKNPFSIPENLEKRQPKHRKNAVMAKFKTSMSQKSVSKCSSSASSSGI
ncbi:GRIP1-associated protein 1-like isoform X2 [Adelges cooleyi]|uniref:GRIP1-associated protein 1-like isoform X2 n=1 Tax=Adelges cooleyi TaxID=133065 RepID=UPI00217F337A|nr:GRIP1-associated protein 1-like isoform X2 [Adelges cooleyi]